ncbi:hypothetical protein QO004_005398 [Rhizobium mesoamericanum]|nr:hypothetical protein [Rhizobium mesoamericanum]
MLMVTLVWALASAGGNIGVDSSIIASPSGTHTVLRKASSLTNIFVVPEGSGILSVRFNPRLWRLNMGGITLSLIGRVKAASPKNPVRFSRFASKRQQKRVGVPIIRPALLSFRGLVFFLVVEARAISRSEAFDTVPAAVRLRAEPAAILTCSGAGTSDAKAQYSQRRD